MPFNTLTPIVEFAEEGWPLTLREELVYFVPENLFPNKAPFGLITVHNGFVTDLASCPKILWNIFPPFGKYSMAAIIHDYLYQTALRGCTRAMADKIMLAAMRELKVEPWKMYAMYTGLRLGGWVTWWKYRRNQLKIG